MLKGEIKKLYRKLDRMGYTVEESDRSTDCFPEIKVYLFVADNKHFLTIGLREGSDLFILNYYNPYFDHTFYFKKLSSIIDWINNN